MSEELVEARGEIVQRYRIELVAGKCRQALMVIERDFLRLMSRTGK